MRRALAPGTLALAVERSGNRKLGDAATTYAAQASCPTDCVFFNGGGCYAETGQVGKFVTAPLNEAAGPGADPLAVAIAEAEAIDTLPASGRPLRLHTVGDCATDEAASVVAHAAGRYMERGGGPVWTYTHGWRTVDRQSWGGVSVLASCESMIDMSVALGRGYTPAVVVEAFPSRRAFRHGPSDVIPCPSQTSDVHCTDCRLCFDADALAARGKAIGFELHGVPFAIRQARRALRTPDDPRRRQTAEQQLRALLADQPTLTARAAADELDMSAAYAGQLLDYLRGFAKHPTVLRRARYDRARRAA